MKQEEMVKKKKSIVMSFTKVGYPRNRALTSQLVFTMLESLPSWKQKPNLKIHLLSTFVLCVVLMTDSYNHFLRLQIQAKSGGDLRRLLYIVVGHFSPYHMVKNNLLIVWILFINSLLIVQSCCYKNPYFYLYFAMWLVFSVSHCIFLLWVCKWRSNFSHLFLRNLLIWVLNSISSCQALRQSALLANESNTYSYCIKRLFYSNSFYFIRVNVLIAFICVFCICLVLSKARRCCLSPKTGNTNSYDIPWLC